MSVKPDLLSAALAAIGAQLRERRLSPLALLEQCLARIEAMNPKLNAFITVTADLAREQARASEKRIKAGHWRGSLDGIPVAVKDFYDTAGIRTTAGFAPFANRVPSRDAELVVRLRQAGAVLIGKTNMHQLGQGTTSLNGFFGAVVNPLDANHVAGGSSGGSAATLAAGMCFATVDTDAVGSGRLPAAMCGVTCHKPTFGLLSGEGILAGEPVDPAILMLSHPTVMARGPEDVTLALGAILNAARGDTLSARRALEARSPIRRLGVVTNYSATGNVRAAFESDVARIKAMNIETREVKVPFEAASFDVSRIEKDRATINETLFADVDALLLPTLSAPAPTVDDARARGDMAVSADNTFFCNYFGLPAITVPSAFDTKGLPLGLQIVGPQGGDGRVLALAHAFELAGLRPR